MNKVVRVCAIVLVLNCAINKCNSVNIIQNALRVNLDQATKTKGGYSSEDVNAEDLYHGPLLEERLKNPNFAEENTLENQKQIKDVQEDTRLRRQANWGQTNSLYPKLPSQSPYGSPNNSGGNTQWQPPYNYNGNGSSHNIPNNNFNPPYGYNQYNPPNNQNQPYPANYPTYQATNIPPYASYTPNVISQNHTNYRPGYQYNPGYNYSGNYQTTSSQRTPYNPSQSSSGGHQSSYPNYNPMENTLFNSNQYYNQSTNRNPYSSTNFSNYRPNNSSSYGPNYPQSPGHKYVDTTTQRNSYNPSKRPNYYNPTPGYQNFNPKENPAGRPSNYFQAHYQNPYQNNQTVTNFTSPYSPSAPKMPHNPYPGTTASTYQYNGYQFRNNSYNAQGHNLTNSNPYNFQNNLQPFYNNSNRPQYPPQGPHASSGGSQYPSAGYYPNNPNAGYPTPTSTKTYNFGYSYNPSIPSQPSYNSVTEPNHFYYPPKRDNPQEDPTKVSPDRFSY